MYPLKQTQPFPYLQWWIAAYSAELGASVLGRTILGRPVALFRNTAGEAQALSGICPHRMYPMAKGRVVAGGLQCGYHGLVFSDADGACVRIPSQSEPPQSGLALTRYPVKESGGLVWIWMGDPARASKHALPDLARLGLEGEGWAVEQHPRARIGGRYTLLIDNLLDLSHVSFIHADTIPNGGGVVHIPVDLSESEDAIVVGRLGKSLPGNPHMQALFPHHAGPVDQRFDAEYLGPALIRTGGAIFRAGEAEPLGATNFIHGVTPETAHSTHYFVMTARDFQTDDARIGAMNLAMGERIQPQDIEAIEAIEKILGEASSLPTEMSCRVDAGALVVRRRLDAQIRAEAQGAG